LEAYVLTGLSSVFHRTGRRRLDGNFHQSHEKAGASSKAPSQLGTGFGVPQTFLVGHRVLTRLRREYGKEG
jgi:hypothetical protein